MPSPAPHKAQGPSFPTGGGTSGGGAGVLLCGGDAVAVGFGVGRREMKSYSWTQQKNQRVRVKLRGGLMGDGHRRVVTISGWLVGCWYGFGGP